MSGSRHQGPGSDHNGFHKSRRPYWRRAHHDWRLWVGACLMLVAITICAMSEEFAWLPRGQPQQRLSDAVGK
jgi:hypothetical protein